jgi:hypothetical protein
MGLGFLEKLWMYSVFVENRNDPDKLAAEYRRNPEKWEQLKAEYPDWENYVAQYPDLRDSLRAQGVPL